MLNKVLICYIINCKYTTLGFKMNQGFVGWVQGEKTFTFNNIKKF